jgi:DDE superfamily endonuclease
MERSRITGAEATSVSSIRPNADDKRGLSPAGHTPSRASRSQPRHPRETFHFTPTSASWLNAVENFFSKMTRQRIRRGVFRSIADLQAAINAYLAEHNASPKPFIWTKSAEAILAKLDRCPQCTSVHAAGEVSKVA